jgi:uncharacterized protein
MAERAGLGGGRRQVVVPAQSGRAVSVGCGDLVRVVDVEGHQVGDMWAVDAANHGRWLSVSHTRDRYERLFPAVGGQFCDQQGAPVLELAGDTSPGVMTPGPRPDGTLAVGVAASSPGDAITFIGRRDLVVILTACSVDCPPLGGGGCSPLRIEISPADAP